MASKNVEMLRAAHESWNRRDFDGVVHNVSDNVNYADRAQRVHHEQQTAVSPICGSLGSGILRMARS